MTKIKPTIVNTRPSLQQYETTKSFQDHGFSVISFPCIEIVGEQNKHKILSQLNACVSADVVIFTSQHAVGYAYKLNPSWEISDSIAVIAVGAKTAQALEQNFSGHIWIPKRQNSIGVLELLQGFKHFNGIKLITAVNGRNVIQRFALENKIRLDQINVYKRQLPQVDDNSLSLLEKTDNLYILATSVTTILNLPHLLPGNIWVKVLNSTVICASTRIEKAAMDIGFIKTENMHTANPEKMAVKLQNN
jgi:uroporphyrinogen-III synthase